MCSEWKCTKSHSLQGDKGPCHTTQLGVSEPVKPDPVPRRVSLWLELPLSWARQKPLVQNGQDYWSTRSLCANLVPLQDIVCLLGHFSFLTVLLLLREHQQPLFCAMPLPRIVKPAEGSLAALTLVELCSSLPLPHLCSLGPSRLFTEG